MRILLALLAGVINALSFAPFNWWPLSIVSFMLLFWVWLNSSAKGAFWYGFIYGIAMFGVGISWIYISIHTFGGMPPAIAAFCIFILIAFMALYPALTGFVQSIFSGLSVPARLTFIMPVLWVLFEWLRGWLFTGLPWLSTGYAMLDTPLSNFAPIGGVYLLSLIALMSVGALLSVLRNLTKRNGALAVIMIAVWITGWQLNETAWTRAEGEPVSVAIIQNDVPLIEKWDEEETNKIIRDYMSISQKYQDVDLIVWPEAAVPDYLDKLSNEFWDDIRNHPADFIFGVLHREKLEGDWKYYNTVAAVSDKVMIYRKQHLVPFGEYFPLQFILGPIISLMDIPMSEFSHWEEPQGPLMAAGNRFATSICYEDAFPEDWRNQVGLSGAFVNVSEDIWFGDSFAPHQRLQMARLRSRESERPMIRSSNNGLSSLINWKGGVDEYAPQFVRYVTTGSIQPRSGMTPYVTFGNKPVLLLAVALLVLALLFGRSRVR